LFDETTSPEPASGIRQDERRRRLFHDYLPFVICIAIIGLLFLYAPSEGYAGPVAGALLFHASAIFVGHAFLRFFFPDWKVHESWLYAWCLGIGIHGYTLFFAAELSFFNSQFARVYFVLALVTGFMFAKDLRPRGPMRNAFRPLNVGTWLIACLYVGLNCIPPAFYDATTYHLGLPMQYAAWGESVVTRHQIYSAFPLLSELSTSLLLLVKGEAAPVNAAHAMMIVPLTLLVRRIATKLFDSTAGLSAGLVLITVPMVHFLVAGTKSDLLLYLMLAAQISASTSMVLQSEGTDRFEAHLHRNGLLMFVFAGMAMAVKLSAAVHCFIFVLLTFIYAKKFFPHLKQALGVGIPVCIALAAPTYLRNWIELGNPTYPFMAGIFGGDSTGGDYLITQAHRVQTLDDVLSLWRLPYDLCFENPDPTMYNLFGGLVFVFLVGAFVWRRVMPIERLWLLYIMISVPYWLATYALLRFHPIMVLMVVIWTGYGIARALAYRSQTAPLVGALVMYLCYQNLSDSVQANSILTRDSLSVHSGQETYDSYLSGALESYAVYQFINENTPDDSIVFMMSDYRLAYLDRRALFSGINTKPRFANIVRESKSPADIVSRIRDTGASYLLFHGATVDLFNKRGLLEWTKEDDSRLREMLRIIGRPLYSQNGYILFSLPDLRGQ
jgi:hypothetical protein